MTPQEAKEISIEVWTYLAEHPEIERKWQLPKELYERIELMIGKCPVCELYGRGGRIDEAGYPCNKECPLYGCDREGGLYSKWLKGVSRDIRSKFAHEILDKLKAWEI